MSLPTVGGLHITTCDEPRCGIDRAKAQRGAVRRIQRDMFAIGRHVECWNRRERVFRESRLSGVAADYISYVFRSSIQSSTVKSEFLLTSLCVLRCGQPSLSERVLS